MTAKKCTKHITHVQSDCFCSSTLLFCGALVAVAVVVAKVPHCGEVPISGLQCYSCSREDNTDALRYCSLNSSALGNNANVACSSDETKCVISKTILGNGAVSFFTRQCATNNFCSDVGCSRPDLKGTVICKSCCGGDLCNNGGGPTKSTAPVTAPSGSSRIPLISDLFMFGSFLICFLVYKVIIA